MDLFWVLVLSTIQLLRCGILEMRTRIIDSLPVGVKCMSFPQIHRLKKTEDLVGACYKAGYDGKCRYKTITNEVKLLCRKHVCLSTTPRRVSRQE